MALLGLFLAFMVGAVLCARTGRKAWSWGLSSCVMPAFVLFAEFVVPATGGGASMWPIALALGALMGALAGGAGVLLADWLQNRQT